MEVQEYEDSTDDVIWVVIRLGPASPSGGIAGVDSEEEES